MNATFHFDIRKIIQNEVKKKYSNRQENHRTGIFSFHLFGDSPDRVAVCRTQSKILIIDLETLNIRRIGI